MITSQYIDSFIFAHIVVSIINVNVLFLSNSINSYWHSFVRQRYECFLVLTKKQILDELMAMTMVRRLRRETG